MKKLRFILIFLLSLFSASAFGQVVKTAAVPYTKGSGYTPNITSSSEIRVDTATSGLYWWNRDALTWVRFYPGVDVITGSIPPAYTPVDNQSLFAVNDDDELYYYNGSAWVQIGGSGGGGIYGGSGTVPDATVATLADDFEFSGPDISSFTVTTGTTNGGQYFSNLSGATVSHRDSSGQSALEFTGTGANFNFTDGSTDRLTITGRDARYAADYSGTFSSRSLVDKGYVDGAVSGGVSIPDGEIAFGNATSDGITSDAAIMYVAPKIMIRTAGAGLHLESYSTSSATGGADIRLGSYDGAAISSGDRLGGIFWAGSSTATDTLIGASIQALAHSNWSGTAARTYLSFQTVNGGGTTLHEKARIMSNSFGNAYSLELRDRTRLDLYNTGNTGNSRIETADSAMYILPIGSIVTGEIAITGKFSLHSVNATLDGDKDNWYMGAAGFLYTISPSAADRTITGIQPVFGTTSTARLMAFYNNGSTNAIFADESASSTAENRFHLPDGDMTLEPGQTTLFLYNSTIDRWTVPNAVGATGATDHGALTGLSDDDHTQYALLAGRATGQTITGGTASGDDLTLRSTTDATKGDIIIADQGGNVTVGGGATASELRILEPSGSGSNYVSLKTDASAANASLSLAYATSTANTASITIGSGDTNAGVALVPKGTGALTFAVPDGASTGGNARGTNAIDLQTDRNAATQVASGTNSVVVGGRRNTASGTYSATLGGTGNVASGNGAVALGGSGAFGLGCTATGTNSFSFGAGADATANNTLAFLADASADGAVAIRSNMDKYGGVAINGMYHLSLSKLTLGTSTQELFLDGSSLRATIGSGSVWIAEVRVMARVSVVGDGTVIAQGDVYAATYKCVIQNLGGTTALVGTVQADMAAQSAASMSGASFAITADDTNDALKIEYVPGPNEGSTTQVNTYAAIWYNQF